MNLADESAAPRKTGPKILAPVDRVDEVEPLIDSGADELYCGLLWEPWLEKYTIAAINRRPGKICNLKSFQSLGQVAEKAHARNIPVGLTINEHYYLNEQLPLLFEYIKRAVDAGVDSLIVSDPALIIEIKEKGVSIDIHLSTGVSIFNSESAKFFQELGVTRVMLERHLTIHEIRELVKNLSGIETSVFIMNSRCPNIDGFCSFQHFQFAGPGYRNACTMPYRITLKSVENSGNKTGAVLESREIATILRQKVWERNHMDNVPCGICGIRAFTAMGIGSLKIVGRGNSITRKTTDIKLIRTLLTWLSSRPVDEKRFIDKARLLYQMFYNRPCRSASCYYPDLLEKFLRNNPGVMDM